MTRLKIRLPGAPEVTLEGRPVTGFESDGVLALPAYLAVESDCPHGRERLAGLLWPSSPEHTARAGLRTLLRDDSAPRPMLDVSAHTVRINRSGGVCADVLALCRPMAASRARQEPSPGPVTGSIEPAAGRPAILDLDTFLTSPAFHGILAVRHRRERQPLPSAQPNKTD